jgi:hypothetical protein
MREGNRTGGAIVSLLARRGIVGFAVRFTIASLVAHRHFV